ncbi:MAG: hypothetical protein AB7R90_02425 [Reyranellaceae bacterium]
MTSPSNFDVYADYNRMLRTWFVLFGVGAIAALIGSKELVDGLKSEGTLRIVVLFLAIGAAAQIVLAFVNKTAAWCQYYGECNEDFGNGRICKFARKVSAYYWLDLVADVATMVCFTVAGVMALEVLAPAQ